jgi:hypothetical protein
VLQWTPTVMLSSTITDLARLRGKVGKLVEESGLAVAWRFEEHAVAAGTPPDQQYLGIAASCDLYVLIVASRQSDATEAEYRAAHNDNPQKVLPFFVGGGSREVEDFRALIESRHTRITRAAKDELVDPIARAIMESISTGSILRLPLLGELDRRIERSRTAIADVPVLLDPSVIRNETKLAAHEVIRIGERVALQGIGGSGKTMAAAIAARRSGHDGRTLPVYVPVSGGTTDPVELIRQRLDSVRFSAPQDLVQRWCVEGRIMLVADGIESLTASTRRRLMSAISNWGQLYPRCGVVVCARRFSPLELSEFEHVGVAPLDEVHLRILTEALGITRQHVRFSPQVGDIAQWPMWATALLVYGTEVSTGLELLQRLLETRLQTACMSSALERVELRAAAAYMAHKLWPATSSSVPVALELLQEWGALPETAMRYASRPAEDVLQRLSEAALLEVGDDVSFPHRLIATILSAEHAITDPDAAADVDDELAPFVAALADDERHVRLLYALLDTHDSFKLARYLRLSPPHERIVDLEGDVQRLTEALHQWSPVGEEFDVVFGDQWIAWRPGPAHEARRFEHTEYAQWRSLSDESIHFWASSPFRERTPEFVAAVYVLARFRNQVLGLDPGGDRYRVLPSHEIRALMHDREKLASVTLGALRKRTQLYDEFLAELGMPDYPALTLPGGEPRVTIWRNGQEAPLVSVAWGGDQPEMHVETSAPRQIEGSTSMLVHLVNGEDRATAYADLTRNIEGLLGLRLGAQNWSRPELVPAWAW